MCVHDQRIIDQSVSFTGHQNFCNPISFAKFHTFPKKWKTQKYKSINPIISSFIQFYSFVCLKIKRASQMQAFKTVNDLKTRSSRMKKMKQRFNTSKIPLISRIRTRERSSSSQTSLEMESEASIKGRFHGVSSSAMRTPERERERGKVHRCKYDKSTEGVSDLDVRRRQRPISRGRNVINARDQTEATSCLTYSPLAVPRREPRLKAC